MAKLELIEGYRRLSDEDRRLFHRWLIGNIVVGAISIVGLIAIAIGNSSHFNNSPSLTQRNVDVSTQFKAAPLMESSESTRHHSSRNGYGH